MPPGPGEIVSGEGIVAGMRGALDTIEATVHAAGLEVQRRLFRALIEKADRELVL